MFWVSKVQRSVKPDGLDGLDLKNSSPWATDRHQGVSSSIPPKPCDIFPKILSRAHQNPSKSMRPSMALLWPYSWQKPPRVKSSKNSTALPEPRKRHSPRPRHWEVQDQTLHPGTRTKSSDCCWSPWRANAQSMPTKIYKNHQRPVYKRQITILEVSLWIKCPPNGHGQTWPNIAKHGQTWPNDFADRPKERIFFSISKANGWSMPQKGRQLKVPGPSTMSNTKQGRGRNLVECFLSITHFSNCLRDGNFMIANKQNNPKLDGSTSVTWSPSVLVSLLSFNFDPTPWSTNCGLNVSRGERFQKLSKRMPWTPGHHDAPIPGFLGTLSQTKSHLSIHKTVAVSCWFSKGSPEFHRFHQPFW